MIDESQLDDPDAVVRADLRGLLRTVASSGAQVRTAARSAEETPLARLRPEGTPQHILVAGPGPAVPLAVDLLAALAGHAVRVTRVRPTGVLADPGALRWALPRWAGPMDLVLLLTPEGSEPGLTELLEQAYRRGCSVVAVCPEGSPLAVTTSHRRNLAVPLTSAPHQEPPGHPAAPGPHWSLITPLLMLGDRLGLFSADSTVLRAVADRLDAVAERCGPATVTEDNPAKTLATECEGSLPLLWSEGPLSRAAARHAAATCIALSGRPALTARLPEAMTAHGMLLNAGRTAGAGTDDFFRDRLEEPAPLLPRVVLLSDEPSLPGSGTSADAARELAAAQGVPISELEAAHDGSPLQTLAEVLAQLDFTAVYLALTEGTGS
ncbi:SIS domain-containing protein [Streptomyces sodiiphilus]|uniref:SIS domain-containing protein n=1 Tax=Streptomyces sodiiphilus TaxID=226217 RepID=A0ABN2PKU0_9ACTN